MHAHMSSDMWASHHSPTEDGIAGACCAAVPLQETFCLSLLIWLACTARLKTRPGNAPEQCALLMTTQCLPCYYIKLPEVSMHEHYLHRLCGLSAKCTELVS